MSKSSIEWTQETWNPIVGCSILSPGCTNCYAMKMAARIEAMNASARPGHHTAPQYDGTTKKVNGSAVWTGKLALAETTLLHPLKRKKPTTYFVNSMGDLFHEDCPDEWIDHVFAVMALCPHHTFQVLTKRAARMRDYMSGLTRQEWWKVRLGEDCDRNLRVLGRYPEWPLRNVRLGISAERQKEADERIPELLATPAAIRFISYEPALGAIDINRWLHVAWQCSNCEHLFAGSHKPVCPECGQIGGWTGSHAFNPPRGQVGPGLDWVICGGESGPDSRPMHPDWARSLRDQCTAANVPFFFKQWGSWYPMIDRDEDDPDWRRDYTCASSQPGKYRILNLAGGLGFHGERVHLMQRYSKKATGKQLDGVEHKALPARPAP